MINTLWLFLQIINYQLFIRCYLNKNEVKKSKKMK